MSHLSRILCTSALFLGAVFVSAADAPKDSPFGQAGRTTASTAATNLEFNGVSSVGKKTMINLYDKQERKSFWVEAGTTSGGVTVVSYDNAHDQVTIRANGVETTLPLRAPSAVVNGTTSLPAQAATPTAAAQPLPTPPPTQQLSQARQEEEARMLVSDLLEIGMAQRRAYEEAQRRAANGQPAQTPPAADPNAPAPVGSPTGTTQAMPAPAAPAQTTAGATPPSNP